MLQKECVLAQERRRRLQEQGAVDGRSHELHNMCPWVGGKVAPATANNWNYAATSVGRSAWVKWGSGPKMPSVGDVYLLYCDEYKRPLPPKPAQPRVKQPSAEPGKPKPKRVPDPLWDPWDAKTTKMGPHMRHVGIIVEVPANDSEAFITADGGQSVAGMQAAHLVKRKFSRRKPGPSDAKYQADWDKQATAKNPYAPTQGIDCLYLSGEAEEGGGNRLLGWIDIDILADHKLVTAYGNRCADPIVWSRYADLECRNGASAK